MTAWVLKKHHLIALAVLVSCFFPLLWISQDNYPSGDDYPAFFHARASGTAGAIRWWYFNWTGRYSSFLVQSLFPSYETWLVAYTVIPIVLFVGGFGCLFYLTKAFLGARFRRREVLTITTCAYVVLVGTTPDVATAFYWLPASWLYMGAVFITCLLLALYIEIRRATTPLAKGVRAIAAGVLIVLLAGLNEISLVFFIGALSFIGGWQVFTAKKPPMLSLAFLALALLFGLVAFLAPGNAIRASQTAAGASVGRALADALGLTAYLFAELLTLPPLLIASALYLAFLEVNRDRLTTLCSSLSEVRWPWILAFLAGVTFASVCVFTAVGIRTLTPRVSNVYMYSLSLGWFFALTVFFANVSPRGVRFDLPRWAVIVLSLALCLSLATGFELRLGADGATPSATPRERLFSAIRTKSVYANAYLDILSGRAAAYRRQNQSTTMRFSADPDGCVTFPPPSHPPATIFVDFVKYPWTWCPPAS